MLWRYIYSDVLKAEHTDHPVLLTENAHNPRKNRERLAKVFFESLRVPSLFIAMPPVLALYASGRTTGVVLDVGETVTSTIPIAEGHCAVTGIVRMDTAGRDVNERLGTLLRKSGNPLSASSSEKQAVRRVKERLGYVATDPKEEELRFATEGAECSSNASFVLPDGNVIQLGPERFRAPEILFNPGIIGVEAPAVHECVKSAIDSVDIDLRRRLYASVVLAVRNIFFHSLWHDCQ